MIGYEEKGGKIHEMMGKPIDLTELARKVNRDIKSSVSRRDHTVVVRDFNLGIRPVKLVRDGIKDQLKQALNDS